MADCNYRFQDAAGAWQTITGKPAMKAALVDGRLDHLMPGGLMAASQKEASANSMKRREGDDSPKFSFAGQDARSADLGSLHDAKSRIEDGEPAEIVRKDTGWFKGIDGEWRFEFSDRDATLNIDKLDKLRKAKYGSSYSLGALLSHPKLYAAYPFLRSSRVFDTDFYEHSGSYDRDSGHFQVSVGMDNDKVKSFLLHEIQHAIQHREGFARGGSPTEMAESAPSDQALNDAKVLRARMDRGESSGEAASWLLNNLARDASSEARYLADRYSSRELHRMPSNPYEAYRRMAGEVEARNVQSRADMTDAERRATPPSRTADVAEKDQTVVMAEKDPEWALPDRSGEKLKRSTSAADSAQGVTAESLPDLFAERFPKLAGAIKTMLDRGALGQKGGLVVLDSNDEATIAREFADRTGRSFDDTVQLFAGAGEDINAFYDPLSGITFMVGPNLSPSSMPSVVLHEMVHGQQRQALDQKAMALIDGRAKQAPALRAFLDRVADRMDTVGEEGNPFEATAYIVELATQEGRQAGFSRADGPMLAWVERNIGKGVADLVRDFVATVRAWAIAHGVELKNVAVDDLVAYAMAGVGKAARGRVVTLGKNSGSMASMSDRQGVAGKQAPTPAGDVEGSAQWAYDAYDSRIIPEGWYVHGRQGRGDLDTGSVLQLTQDWDVADQYSSRPGSSKWLIRPKPGANTLDLSSSSTEDMDRVVNAAMMDFRRDRLPWLDDLESALGRDAEAEDVEKAVRDEFAPENIVESAKAYDNQEMAEWLAEVFDYPSFVATPDGALVFSRDGIDAVKVPNEPSASASPDAPGVSFSRSGIAGRVRAAAAQSNPQQAGAWPIDPPDSKDKLIYTLQDKQIDTKRVVEAARKAGVSVTDAIDPYLQEELYHGRSAKRFNDFRNNELRPLLDSIRAAGLSLGDVENYLWASHAKERNAQIAKVNDKMPDGGSGLTNAQADDLLAGRDVTVNGQVIRGVNQAKLADLQGVAKQVQAINAKTRQMLVDSGMETPETIKAWEQAYANYVPLHREDVDQGGLGTGMGFSVRGASSKRAVGSGRTVVDILGNIANQRERQIARVEKNRVGQSVLGLVKAFPNKDFWTADTPPKVKTVESQTVFTAYDKAGNVLGKYSTQQQADKAHPSASVTIKRSTEDAVVERIDPTFRSKDEVFHVRVDGRDRFITFNPRDERAMRMVSALKNLDADQLGAVLQVTSKATRFFAAMATQYNPIWGVVNLTRDVQGALLNLSTTPLRGKEKEVFGHTLSALRGIYADLRAHRAGKSPSSKWARLFEEMQGEGGATGYKDMFANAKDRTEAIERELDPTRWMQSPLGKIFTANGQLKVPLGLAQRRAEGFFGWLSDFNETTENAIRLASYKTAIDAGMSKERAASIAKNISINFNRKGQVATQAGALYAFFNAAMQGTARLAETLRGPMGKKIIGGGIALGVMQAMMLAAAGMDDGEPPEFVKERGFIIPIGDGKYVSIPMPLGFHVLPSIGRIPAEYALSGFKDGTKRIADLFGLMADTFNPIGNAGLSLQTIAPTVIDPLAALAENKDWTGKQIAKEDMSSLHPTPGYLRAKNTASELSKFIAYYANAASGGTDFKSGLLSPTPDQLDYLIGQIAGGVGREALKIDQTLSSAVTGEDLPIHKVPLLGRFIGDTKGQSAESGKFYDSLKRINQHQAELKGLREKGRADEAAEYLAENPEARLTLMANATERGLSELNKLKRKAIEAGDSDRVKQIESMAHERMRLFNERVASLEK